MTFDIVRSQHGWLFRTRDVRAPGEQGGGGTSTTFCKTKAEAVILLKRFKEHYGVAM